MTTYTATFSTGKTVTRKSHHAYLFAVALVNKSTGQLRNVKFTSDSNPTPDWRGELGLATKANCYGMSANEIDRINRNVLAERQNWNVEVVRL